MFTDSDLDELEDREAVHLVDLPQRSFSEVWSEARRAAPGKARRFHDPQYLRRLAEMRDFLVAVRKGQVPEWTIRETMATSDFPLLFGDILDTRLLNQYTATPNTWSQYAQRGTVNDFRRTRMIALDGIQQPLYPANRKAELEGTTESNALTETPYYTNVEVYERGVSFNWRMLMNRRGDFLSRLPAFLTRAAVRTEEKFASDLYMDSTGPDATFFSVGNANIVASNPALSTAALKTALNTMYAQVDSGGDPIVIEGVILVVPPLLSLTADEITKAFQLEFVPATSAAGTRFTTPAWVNRFKPVTNWYQPVVDTSANKHTTWYLFAQPQDRPAMEVTFLNGYETPTLWQKAPNMQRLGGAVDPIMGDYDDNSIHQKIMHIIGGTLIDPKMAVASNGSGS